MVSGIGTKDQGARNQDLKSGPFLGLSF